MKRHLILKIASGLASLLASVFPASGAVLIEVDMDTGLAGIQSSRLASPGELFTAALVMTTDAGGISSYSVSVKYDTAELDLDGSPAATELLPAGFTFNFTAGVPTESDATGDVGSFEAGTFGAGPTLATFTIGTIKYKVAVPVTDLALDITPGFFAAGIDGAFDNGGTAAPPTFVGGTVNVVPEPAGAALLLTGLGAIVLRRGRQRV